MQQIVEVTSIARTNFLATAGDTQLGGDNFDNVIVSVGMCNFKEVANMVKLFENSKNLILFYAVSDYPAPLDQLNLDTIDLYKHFKYPLGYSSHDIGVYPAAATVLKGVKYIEKHFKGTDFKENNEETLNNRI